MIFQNKKQNFASQRYSNIAGAPPSFPSSYLGRACACTVHRHTDTDAASVQRRSHSRCANWCKLTTAKAKWNQAIDKNNIINVFLFRQLLTPFFFSSSSSRFHALYNEMKNANKIHQRRTCKYNITHTHQYTSTQTNRRKNDVNIARRIVLAPVGWW